MSRSEDLVLIGGCNSGSNPEEILNLMRGVFQMCDVHRSGQITIDDLLTLGQQYLGQDTKDLADALRCLDPLGDGTLSFEDFCRGVGSIIESTNVEAVPRDQHLTCSSPTKRSRTLVDWGELSTSMPNSEEHSTTTTTPTSSSSRTIVANEEDLLLTSSDDSSSSTSRISSSSPAGDSGYSKSSTPTSSSSTAPHHQAGSISGCSSMSEREEISFEGYGESDNHAVTTENSVEPDTTPATGMMSSGRTNWMGGMLRNSLRRSDYNSPGKRGAAISNQLGYGKNGISSGNRSLTNGGDLNGEDFCSDASLEDDVVDLGHKVNILQQQITVLADTQFSSDDRYSRSKQENAALTARLQMLEESLREVELRAQQQLSEEQRRNRELIVRVEREKQLEIENCTIKLQSVEREVELTREECARLRAQTERLRGERSALQQRLCEAETSLLEGQEELRRMSELMKREREQWAIETTNSRQLATELSSEIESLRNSQQFGSGGGSQQSPASTPRVSELESEIKSLKQQNNSLREANDELQAQLFSRGLEEGRTLLHDMATNSLAAEFEVMSQDDIRTALREAQEVNAQLRSYIEGILLTIVENQPSLLERKPPQ